MERSEILEKSRKENKNQNLFEKEVMELGNRYACIAAAVVATVFFVVQIFVGGGMNYGLYTVVFSMPMAGFWVKYAKLHRKHELAVALGYTVGVSRNTISSIETGHFSPTAKLALIICIALDRRFEDVVYFDE